jgi:competence protein ComEC
MIAPASGSRYRVNALRERVSQNIAQHISDERSRGVIQALATADRSGLASSDMALLAATGTSHLLAISGLHVGLAATGGMWLSRFLFLFLPLSRMGGATYLLMVTGGLSCALAYAALAGFEIPTLRSVLMLSVALSAVILYRAIHPARALVSSLAVILLINPFAPLGAGMWFSFVAVAALLWVFQPRTGRLKWWQTMLMAQAGVILVLFRWAPPGSIRSVRPDSQPTCWPYRGSAFWWFHWFWPGFWRCRCPGLWPGCSGQ